MTGNSRRITGHGALDMVRSLYKAEHQLSKNMKQTLRLTLYTSRDYTASNCVGAENQQQFTTAEKLWRDKIMNRRMKGKAWKKNEYPIIICFSPAVSLSLYIQMSYYSTSVKRKLK